MFQKGEAGKTLVREEKEKGRKKQEYLVKGKGVPLSWFLQVQGELINMAVLFRYLLKLALVYATVQ